MNQSRQFASYGQVPSLTMIQTSGQGSFSAPSAYKQNGPRVAGNDRYDNYGGNGQQYGGGKSDDMGCCAKTCACLGATICCCCVLDALTWWKWFFMASLFITFHKFYEVS